MQSSARSPVIRTRPDQRHSSSAPMMASTAPATASGNHQRRRPCGAGSQQSFIGLVRRNAEVVPMASRAYDATVQVLEHTFVFADLAGYTALTEAHGDGDAAAIALTFHELARRCLGERAELVKTIGDAVMVAAPSIDDGVSVALRVAAAVAAAPHFPAVRIGVHAGPATCHGGDYFGAAVNLAARVAAVARGGEMVATEPVAAVAIAHRLASARPMGTVRLKNVLAPVALYELGTGCAPGPLRRIDPVCRMQVVGDATRPRIDVDGTVLYFCSDGCAARFRLAPEQYLAGFREHVH
jgi:adenylate cyclase